MNSQGGVKQVALIENFWSISGRNDNNSQSQCSGLPDMRNDFKLKLTYSLLNSKEPGYILKLNNKSKEIDNGQKLSIYDISSSRKHRIIKYATYLVHPASFCGNRSSRQLLRSSTSSRSPYSNAFSSIFSRTWHEDKLSLRKLIKPENAFS